MKVFLLLLRSTKQYTGKDRFAIAPICPQKNLNLTMP